MTTTKSKAKKPVVTAPKNASVKMVSRGVAKKDLLAMACCSGGVGNAKR